MRKVMILALILTMVLGLCSCAATPANTDTSKNDMATAADNMIINNDATEPNPEPEPEKIEAEPEETETDTEKERAFEPVLVVDNDQCKIEVTGIDADNMWGYTLKVNLENKSSDKLYMYSVVSAAINGVMCDPFFATEVAAGKKSINEINFMSDALDEAGVGEYTDIELVFRVYDSDDWMADDVAYEIVNIYPYGAEAATKFEKELADTDIVLLDNEYVAVIATGTKVDAFGDFVLDLYLVNKTDVNVMFSIDEASVNDYMVDTFYASSVMPEKSAFSDVCWFETSLAEIGITDMETIEKIEFAIRAYNDEDWLADDFASEIVVLNP